MAPPWYEFNSAFTSSYTGPLVQRVLVSSVDVNLGIPVYKTLFDFLGGNLFAAFPSMHSAMPWLVFLFAFKIWRWKALPVVIIPVGTWFSAVYLGEHYFVDVLGGIAYATGAFIAVETLLPILARRSNFLKKHMPVDRKDSEASEWFLNYLISFSILHSNTLHHFWLMRIAFRQWLHSMLV